MPGIAVEKRRSQARVCAIPVKVVDAIAHQPFESTLVEREYAIAQIMAAAADEISVNNPLSSWREGEAPEIPRSRALLLHL
jgi:hypothetical protein